MPHPLLNAYLGELYISHDMCCEEECEAASLLIQLKALPLAFHIGFIKAVAARLILTLHEQLAIGHGGGVLNVLEVLHPL